MDLVDKGKLVKLAQNDNLVTSLKGVSPSVYQALKNHELVLTELVSKSYPAAPAPLFLERFYIPTLSVGVISIAYQVKMPIDPRWVYQQINLYQVTITATTAPTTTDVITDILVSQNKGTTTAKSIFQTGSALTLPVGLKTSRDVLLNVNSFVDGDVLSFNVTQSDAAAAGIEILLQGSYQVVSK